MSDVDPKLAHDAALVSRLRDHAMGAIDLSTQLKLDLDESADEIERLGAEVARLNGEVNRLRAERDSLLSAVNLALPFLWNAPLEGALTAFEAVQVIRDRVLDAERRRSNVPRLEAPKKD